jgi:hypothetical protein
MAMGGDDDQAMPVRKRMRRREADPGPARPITILFVAILAVLFFLVAFSMANHHFLRGSRYNYYHDHIKTPWHFLLRSPLAR